MRKLQDEHYESFYNGHFYNGLPHGEGKYHLSLYFMLLITLYFKVSIGQSTKANYCGIIMMWDKYTMNFNLSTRYLPDTLGMARLRM